MRRILASVVVIALPAVAAAQQAQTRMLALTGQQAPGRPPGSPFLFFGADPAFTSAFSDPPRIDEAGNVVFTAAVPDPAGGPNSLGGVWRATPSLPAHLALFHGDPAPGASGSFQIPTLFMATPELSGGNMLFPHMTSTLVRGLWSDRAGPLAAVLISTQHLPGTPAAATIGTMAPLLRGGSTVVLNANYVVTPGLQEARHEGLWRDREGAMQLIAMNGTRAPGTPKGVSFDTGTPLAFFGPIGAWGASDNGLVAFSAYLGGPGVVETNDEGIWVETPTGLELVVREGDAAPQAGPGVRFGPETGLKAFANEDAPTVWRNDAGSVLFGAMLSGPADFRAASLWVKRAGALELLGRQHTLNVNPPPVSTPPPPGFEPGFSYSHFNFGLINNTGEVAFQAIVHNGAIPFRAIYTDRGGSLRLIARGGGDAPGIPGATFRRMDVALQRINHAGHISYSGFIEGPGVMPFVNDQVVYQIDPQGVTHLVLRSGDPFQVAPGDTRTIGVINRGPGMAEGTGEMVFELFFTDGSVAIAAARPAPCAANCDASTTPPVLNVADFLCFLNRFAAGDPRANCDGSTTPPVLNIADFSCFLNAFAAGCP